MSVCVHFSFSIKIDGRHYRFVYLWAIVQSFQSGTLDFDQYTYIAIANQHGYEVPIKFSSSIAVIVDKLRGIICADYRQVTFIMMTADAKFI